VNIICKSERCARLSWKCLSLLVIRFLIPKGVRVASLTVTEL
jgi:hypothetical protein